jgi:outer membrane immunogenic protein
MIIHRAMAYGLIFGATIVSAEAADIPLIAAAQPASACGWCGVYFGADAGYAWSYPGRIQTNTYNISSAPGLNGNLGAAISAQGTGEVAAKSSALIAGSEVGYNWQTAGFVYGLQTDIQGLGWSKDTGSITTSGFVRGTPTSITSTGIIYSSQIVRYLGTLRGRTGILATPNVLIYATGGLSYGQVSTNSIVSETIGAVNTGPFGTSGGASATRFGWVAGAGVEWTFWSKFSAKIEYRYYDLGSLRYELPTFNQFGGVVSALQTVNASQSVTRFSGSNTVFGINYHF